ncbi:IPT/TIG domain-containing protein [Edaphobacter aggregans]|uniref:IPT/TIG domain-containing protein n=1 Tax=Edaphobacter aggregans TaxID=570835 RepID=UPI0014707248|nr:IPT/TIG domain-containing protein [Edaphobacter aggregans]
MIASLAPASANVGSSAFTLTVNGSGFSNGATVQWNGSGRTTSFVNATQLTAAITAADIANSGTAQITVASKSKTSIATTFAISFPPNPVPTITSLSPATAAAGGSAFTLTVNGTNFVSGATVQWDGAARTTTVVSPTQVTASITAADVVSAGSKSVTVVNPSPGGGASSAVAFTITSLSPSLSSLSPATATSGGAAFTLTVNGTGFLSSASVAWNGSVRPTTVVSSTQLTASIAAADIASAGTASVDVVQGGLRSTNQLNFTINAAAPMLTSLSPNTVVAGSAGFDLTVNGTGFTNSAAVTWNGTNRPTAFVSSTQLKATLSTADIATAGNATIDVVQGGIHAASQLSFAITAAKPVIASISPATAVLNSPATTITVTGTGFTPNSTVQRNGTNLTTSYMSSTQLQANLPTANLTAVGSFSIAVVNPASEGGASAATSFTVTEPVSGQIVQLVSASYVNGGASNWSSNNSPPTVSQDGRYVGFASYSSDIVAGDTNGETDGFLRDTCVGSSAPAGCTPATTRVTVDTTGAQYMYGGAYRFVMLSSDARWVGFDRSYQLEVDIRDTCLSISGCTPSTIPVSYVPGAATPSNTTDCCSTMSPDGRYVLYNKVYLNPDSTGTVGVYVRDTCLGATSACTPTITRVATGKTSTPVQRPFMADISTGGRYVLFRAPGVRVDPALSSTTHIFVQDTCIGASAGCTITYTMVDVTASGGESEGNLANDAVADEAPSFSKDGRYVVFSTTDKNMIAGRTINNGSEVYLRDTCIGAPAGCTPSTILISELSSVTGGPSKSYIGFRSVSEHGRYVAYLHQGDDPTNIYITTVMVRDTCIGASAGCVPSTSVASTDPNQLVPSTHSSFFYPSISADGHYVAFMSGIGSLVYLARTGY